MLLNKEITHLYVYNSSKFIGYISSLLINILCINMHCTHVELDEPLYQKA